MNFHDVELLSAYLDGQLSPSEAARLEARIGGDREMRRVMEDLRAARGLLRALPQRKAPHNFTLRPNMRDLAAPTPRAFPVLRFASVLASILLLGTIAVNGLVPLAADRLLSAPAAPAYGMGGGGAAAEPAATPAPAEPSQPLLAAAPTAPPEATAPPQDLQSQAQKTAPQPERAAPARQQPIPTTWQFLLAGFAVLLALAAWYLNADASRRFRQRWSEKRER